MSLNDIASLLVCKISKVLPEYPVVSSIDGELYEKSELEKSGVPFKPCLRTQRIIEKLLASGQVNDEYIGAWAKSAHYGEACEVTGNEIVELIEKAQAGDTTYMIELAELYLAGQYGVDKDEKKAYELFERAADIGDGLAAARKADCLLMGLGIDRDYEEAYETLKEETDSGKYAYVMNALNNSD